MTDNINNLDEDDVHIQLIYNLLNQNEIIQRYNESFRINLLENLSFCNRLRRFSWSKLFKVIHHLSSDNEEPINDSTLLAIEMFGLAIRIFDDAIDSDGPLKDSISYETCQILSMELLIYSFYLLSKNDIIPFDTLQSALSSQFYDHFYQDRELITTVDDYFNKVIGKSTYVFLFYFSLSFPDSSDWKLIASNLGTISQIKNDLVDIFSENSNKWNNNSLPYILLNSVTNNDYLNSIKNKKNSWSKSDSKFLQKKFIEIGGFDYCMHIIDHETQEFDKIIDTVLSTNQKMLFKSYLERIKFFEF